MTDILLNLIVLAVLAVIGGAVFLLVRRNQAAEEQKLVQMATQRGWTYEPIREPLAWGLHIRAPGWTLESLSRSSGQEAAPGSSNISMSTTWQAGAAGSPLLVGPRTSQVDLGGFGDMLTRQMLELALGAEAEGLSEVRVGGGDFHKRYMLWAQSPFEAAEVVTPAVQAALLAWKGAAPVITRTSNGLTIELRGVRARQADEVDAIVALGETLLRSN
ncbi:MAG: hypothetical protein HY869_00700 [Chloroflexi bacterium]|nr:hypothetical protein [Chloroflexota bacterium]